MRVEEDLAEAGNQLELEKGIMLTYAP